MRKKDIAIDYRMLLLSTMKERYLSLAIGAGTIVIILSIGFILTLSKLKSAVPSNRKIEKKEVKEKSIKKKIQTYVVKEGDQLFLIAEKLYGSGQNIQAIIKTNNIINPDLLEVGQELIIPEVKSK